MNSLNSSIDPSLITTSAQTTTSAQIIQSAQTDTIPHSKLLDFVLRVAIIIIILVAIIYFLKTHNN